MQLFVVAADAAVSAIDAAFDRPFIIALIVYH